MALKYTMSKSQEDILNKKIQEIIEDNTLLNREKILNFNLNTVEQSLLDVQKNWKKSMMNSTAKK